jgi:hypothetical protein
MGFYLASKRRLLISGAVLAVSAAALVPTTAKAAGVEHHGPTTWSPSGPVTPAKITGGPCTLGRAPATYGSPTAGYCDASGTVPKNPGTELFQPACFPNVSGRGQHLQGFFDYRPKDTDEAVLAAKRRGAGGASGGAGQRGGRGLAAAGAAGVLGARSASSGPRRGGRVSRERWPAHSRASARSTTDKAWSAISISSSVGTTSTAVSAPCGEM